MSEILQGLQGFTNYLAAENVRRDQEWEQQKAKISAERIASSFKSLSADHTARDARSLMYDVIADAAALDSLPENMGLIQSLYSDSMQGIENYKKEKQDKALLEHMQTYDTELPEGITGQQALQLTEFDIRTRKGYDVFNTEGQKFHTIYDAKGREKQKIVLDPRTQAQKDAEDLALYTEQQRIAARFQRSTQPKFTPWNDPVTGEQLSFNPATGLAYKPEMDEQGNVRLVPHLGGLSRPGTYSTNNINNLHKQIKAADDVIKRTATIANIDAGSFLSRLDLQIPVGGDNKRVATALGFVNSNRAEVIAAIDVKADNDPEMRASLMKELAQLDNSYDELVAAEETYKVSVRSLDQDTIKKKYGVTPEEYDYIDSEVTDVINNLNKYMTNLFSKGTTYNPLAPATDYEQQKGSTARAIAGEIRAAYTGRDADQLIRAGDYQSMWARLSPDARGKIMLKLSTSNVNK